MKPKEKLDKFIEQLKNRDDVLTIILFGSWARGDNRPDSDFDLLVIQKDGFRRVAEFFEDHAFEVTYTTEKYVTEYWQSHKPDCINLWKVANVLFDKDGTGSRLKNIGTTIMSEKRALLSSEELHHFSFDFEDQTRAIEAFAKNDIATAIFLLNKKIALLVELYFAITAQWPPHSKQQLKVIRQQNKKLGELIDSFCTTETLSKKIDLARKIKYKILDDEALKRRRLNEIK